MLQLVDGLGIEQVILALASPLVLAARPQVAVSGLGGVVEVGEPVPFGNLGSEHVETHTVQLRGGSGEEAIDEVLSETHRLEDLRPGVAGHRRDPHLGHHFEHTLGACLDVVALRGALIDLGNDAAAHHVVDRFEGEVRVDAVGAIAQQQGHVVHLAGIPALGDETHHRAGLVADQVVMHSACQQQRGNWRVLSVAVAV